jgi:hypothetical protein
MKKMREQIPEDVVQQERPGKQPVWFVFLGKSKLGKVSNGREGRGGEEDPTHLLRLGTCTGTIFGHRES